MIRKLLSEADSQALPKRQRLSLMPDEETETGTTSVMRTYVKLQRLSWMPDEETETGTTSVMRTNVKRQRLSWMPDEETEAGTTSVMRTDVKLQRLCEKLQTYMPDEETEEDALELFKANARKLFTLAPAEPPLQGLNIKRLVPPRIINALLVPLDIFLRTSAASLADQSTAAPASTASPADQHEEVDAASVGSGSRKRAHDDVSEASIAVGSEVPPQGIWWMQQYMAINEAYHAMQEKLDGQLWVNYREDGWSRVAKHLRPIVIT